jgi:hypothetical protein
VPVGRGYEGSIRLGNEGDAAAERINNNGAATSTSGTDFGNAIKNFARSVNLAGCSTGGQGAGGQLLRDIEATGVRATAYTSSVYYGTSKMYIDNWGTKVPTPGSVALLGLAGLTAALRRRA